MDPIFKEAKDPISLQTLLRQPSGIEFSTNRLPKNIKQYHCIHVVTHKHSTKCIDNKDFFIIDEGAQNNYTLIPLSTLHNGIIQYEANWGKTPNGKPIDILKINTALGITEIDGLSDIMLIAGLTDSPVKINSLLELYQFLMLVL